MDIGAWLRELGLGQYEPAFRANDIDAEVLLELTAEDLKDLGITSIGHRRKLLAAIAALRTPAPPPAAPSDGSMASAAAPPTLEAERRQLTVMFVDMVGSTALGSTVDAEQMSEILRAYRAAVAGAVAAFEGHVAKYMGDGVLAYFGYPRAHEDEAERAVRAGLAATAAVQDLKTSGGVALAARVGIATGPVVVGELIGEGPARERAVVGDTPNLAARLQGLAQPGEVLVAGSTRRLLGELFEFEPLGPQLLKGFDATIEAFRVGGEGKAESRFEALHGSTLKPLVGREQELALLDERWSRAVGGEGQVVLLCGEPGIGKSRIVRALRESLAGEQYTLLNHFCSPYHTNSALYPVLSHLERAARFDREDSTATKLDKLEKVLAMGGGSVSAAAALLAAALGVATDERYSPLTLSPQRQKQRTFEVLIEQVAALAARQPVLAVYEDAHWMDPSTVELLGLAMPRFQHLPVLVVITHRPEFKPPWTGQAHVTQLSLSRLTRRHGSAVALGVTGGRALPPEVLDQIVTRTDGVPLFVEELTKSVLESGLLRGAGDHLELIGPLQELAIPATLHDSLLARLDHLAPMKELAQIGAAIGRDFSFELLAAVAPYDEGTVKDALAQLCRSELIYYRGGSPEATYSFKHALVQDTAYSSLLRSRRQQLHARIADVLEERAARGIETLPEILARHFTEAGLHAQAVGYWRQAAQRAIQRSATLEAIAHLRQALTLMPALPDTPEDVRLELDVQLALGTAYMAAEGWGAPVTDAAFARAEELCERVDAAMLRTVAGFGRFLVYLTRGEPDAALATSRAMLRRAEGDRDRVSMMIANRCAGISSVHLGFCDKARRHLEVAISLYIRGEDSGLAYQFSYDPILSCLGYSAHALISSGYPDQALARYKQLLEEIGRHNHSPSIAYGLLQASLCIVQNGPWCDRPRNVLPDFTMFEKLVAVSTEHGFSQWRIAGRILQGWHMVLSGDADRGLTQLREWIRTWRNGARAYTAHWLVLLADALDRVGQPEASVDIIDEALALVNDTNERWREAELRLRKGGVLLASAARDRAETSFHEALKVARDQKSKFWELRAATSLARLWAERDDARRAQDLLAPVYAWFTEGHDTVELKEAHALLNELGWSSPARTKQDA